MELEPRFSETEIRDVVRRVAGELSNAYREKNPVLVGVLKGSFVFMADLIRELTIPFELDFLRAQSYGAGTQSSGEVQITKDVEIPLEGRHVILIEDIADTGITLSRLMAHVRSRKPASVKCCVLLVRQGCPEPEFWGLSVGPGFVVGYGLDCGEQYRGLRDIRALVDKGAE